MRDAKDALDYWQRRELARKHVLSVIWLSITAAQWDILKRPDLAQQASRDAADNCKRIADLASKL